MPDLIELALGGYLEDIQVRIEGTASAREAALRERVLVVGCGISTARHNWSQSDRP